MKVTSIAQGLSSIASKLHPQLPLTSKESQRLLTALTTSFRQRLDEAHPRLSGKDEQLQARKGADVKNGTQNLHSSSAAFADRHLASVLTNPLIAKSDDEKKPELDYATAKVTLQKNPSKDPIKLLEEYQEKGTATIPIAVLCLETFRESIASLPAEKQQEIVVQTGAGRRTLLWLWKNKLHETNAFADDQKLVDIMSAFVCKEGFEDYLWDWVKIDMALGDQTQDRYTASIKNVHYCYRWKGHIIRAIVAEKLKSSHDHAADSALHAMFRACDLKRAAMARHSRHWIPLGAAGIFLYRALATPIFGRWGNTDPGLYDRFVESIDLCWDGKPLFAEFTKAQLLLAHPSSPSPLPALGFLKRLLLYQPLEGSESLLEIFQSPRNLGGAQLRFNFMIRTAAQLQDDGRTSDADWVIAEASRLFPDLSRYIAKDLQKFKASDKPEETRESTKKIAPERLPFPTFT